MRALRIHAQGGARALVYESAPPPLLGTGDLMVTVRAASYTPGELDWPSTWVDRSGHDRAPIIPCHEVSGIVAEMGFGASGFEVGDEVYGLTDWYRDGGAAELVAVEARNLAPRPQSIDYVAASTLPLAGLTAHQALFRHGRLQHEENVLVLGAGGGVGNLAVQMAHDAGGNVTAAGRPRDEAAVLEAGASAFVDLAHEPLLDLGGIALVVDCVGGDFARMITVGLGSEVRVVSIVDPAVTEALGPRGRFFVVEPDHGTLTELTRMVDAGRLQASTGPSAPVTQGRDLLLAKDAGGIPGKVSLTVC
jgi:NADPH:quinone reductase-like Zn-dependent oxidoreductase